MLSLLSIITYVDRVCIAVAGPRMQDALHISPQAWGWVTSVFFVKGHGYTEAALVLSSLPYVVGGCANGLGGLASDWLVRRCGLKTGRRALGVAGLSSAAVFMAATVVTTDGRWALVFLSLAYPGILAQQPNLCAVCLDMGRKHAGSVFGFMNMSANAASAVSSVVFGYLVAYYGSLAWERGCGWRSILPASCSKKSGRSPSPSPNSQCDPGRR